MASNTTAWARSMARLALRIAEGPVMPDIRRYGGQPGSGKRAAGEPGISEELSIDIRNAFAPSMAHA
jgi:hypothetical protein